MGSSTSELKEVKLVTERKKEKERERVRERGRVRGTNLRIADCLYIIVSTIEVYDF